MNNQIKTKKNKYKADKIELEDLDEEIKDDIFDFLDTLSLDNEEETIIDEVDNVFIKYLKLFHKAKNDLKGKIMYINTDNQANTITFKFKI